jgi:hypothetical protein
MPARPQANLMPDRSWWNTQRMLWTPATACMALGASIRHSQRCSRLVYGTSFTGNPVLPNALNVFERAAEVPILRRQGAESSTKTLDRVRNCVPLRARVGLTPLMNQGGCASCLLNTRRRRRGGTRGFCSTGWRRLHRRREARRALYQMRNAECGRSQSLPPPTQSRRVRNENPAISAG